MTPGEKAVVSIRATALSDELRRVIAMGRLNERRRKSPWQPYNDDLSWAAQRLMSACDRALGTRGRHYDRGRT